MPEVGLEAASTRYLLVLGLLCVIACHNSRDEQEHVYRAALEYIRATGELKGSAFLVGSQPEAPYDMEMQALFGPDSMSCSSWSSIEGLDHLKERFRRANSSKLTALRKAGLIRDVMLVPVDNYRDAAGRFSWDKVFEHYGKRAGHAVSLPSSFIIFSGVGFDDWSRRALVFVRVVGYFGEYLLLEKKGPWTVKDHCRVWVS